MSLEEKTADWMTEPNLKNFATLMYNPRGCYNLMNHMNEELSLNESSSQLTLGFGRILDFTKYLVYAIAISKVVMNY